MKTTKRLLALLLAIIAMFSVLTVAVSAEDAEEPDVSISLNDFFKDGGSINFTSKIAERTQLIANWVKGACAFVVSLALQPIKVIISQFGVVTVA